MLGTSISPVVDFTLKILLDKIDPLTSPVVSLMLILVASNELNLTSPVPPSIIKSPVKIVSFKIDSPVVTTIFKLLQLTFSNLTSPEVVFILTSPLILLFLNHNYIKFRKVRMCSGVAVQIL